MILLAGGFICVGQPIQALRFEGLWKLNGPTQSKLDFQVNGDTITATYYHPQPSTLSDVQIEGDRFSAWYLDEFASRVNMIGQLEGSSLRLIVEPPGGRAPVNFSASRIAPDQYRGAPRRVSGSLNTSGKSANGEFNFGGHNVVFSGGMEGNCVSGSFGADGKGASMNGCLSVSKHTP